LDSFERDAIIAWKSLIFLKRLWPHAPRSAEDRDQGFERSFREYIWSKLRPELISSYHDLSFAAGLSTLSGLTHELDLLARWENQEWVFELKNGGGSELSKEMLMVFNEKVLDFYFANYGFLSTSRIMRCLLTGAGWIQNNLRAYCAVWGIVLIDNELFPIPALPALFEQYKKYAMSGKLPGVEEGEITEALDQSIELVELACRPLGEIFELSDLKEQLAVRIDHMPGGMSAIELVEHHRALCQQINKWHSIRSQGEN